MNPRLGWMLAGSHIEIHHETPRNYIPPHGNECSINTELHGIVVCQDSDLSTAHSYRPFGQLGGAAPLSIFLTSSNDTGRPGLLKPLMKLSPVFGLVFTTGSCV